jgi:hypothetical protein
MDADRPLGYCSCPVRSGERPVRVGPPAHSVKSDSSDAMLTLGLGSAYVAKDSRRLCSSRRSDVPLISLRDVRSVSVAFHKSPSPHVVQTYRMCSSRTPHAEQSGARIGGPPGSMASPGTGMSGRRGRWCKDGSVGGCECSDSVS